MMYDTDYLLNSMDRTLVEIKTAIAFSQAQQREVILILNDIAAQLHQLNNPKADHQVMVNNLVTQEGLPRG